MADRAREGVANGVDFVGVAGGDGTMGGVAGVLVGGAVPLLVIPAGTRNHFAGDLDVTSIAHAAEVAARGQVRSVSVGQIGDRTFVNNASVGLYPALVRHRERHEGAVGKRRATLRAAMAVARQGRPLLLTVDDRPRQAWAVFVGNGRYGDGPFAVVNRESLAGADLDVRVLRADRRLSRLRLVGALLAGAGARSQVIDAWAASEVEVGLADGTRGPVPVALDGEVASIETPLRFRRLPPSLPVLVPPSFPGSDLSTG